jgi:hypothetical protein
MKVVKWHVVALSGTIVPLVMMWLLCPAISLGQDTNVQKPPMAEDVFKNVQVLRGIPVDEFMDTMGFFSASTGMNCVDCHGEEAGSSWPKYAVDTPLKQTARRMILMMDMINRANFAGRRIVSCYTCHRVGTTPEFIPSLAEQYSVPPPREPYNIAAAASDPAAVRRVLEKYVLALGGVQRLSSLNSFYAKGTYEGFDTEMQKVPAEIFAKAPAQRAVIVHTLDGDTISTFDGRVGWSAGPETLKPVPVLQLSGGELEGAKLDAELSFPARIEQFVGNWVVGDAITIDDADVVPLQGTGANGTPVKFYFDSKSGFLVRQVRYVKSMVGLDPLQIDYSDYRDVAGMKLPFRWVVTWVDNQSTIELSEVHANVQIEATKFGKPSAPVTPKSATPEP